MEDTRIYITCRKSWVIVFPSNLMCFIYLLFLCLCAGHSLGHCSLTMSVPKFGHSLGIVHLFIIKLLFFKFKIRVQLLTLLYL